MTSSSQWVYKWRQAVGKCVDLTRGMCATAYLCWLNFKNNGFSYSESSLTRTESWESTTEVFNVQLWTVNMAEGTSNYIVQVSVSSQKTRLKAVRSHIASLLDKQIYHLPFPEGSLMFVFKDHFIHRRASNSAKGRHLFYICNTVLTSFSVELHTTRPNLYNLKVCVSAAPIRLGKGEKKINIIIESPWRIRLKNDNLLFSYLVNGSELLIS